jgi:hypothetical protein
VKLAQSYINKQLRIANSPDPKAAIEDQRAKTNAEVAKVRGKSGSYVGANDDPRPLFGPLATSAPDSDDHVGDRLDDAWVAFLGWRSAVEELRPVEAKEHKARVRRWMLDTDDEMMRQRPAHISFDNAAALLDDLGVEDMAPNPVRHIMKDGVKL